MEYQTFVEYSSQARQANGLNPDPKDWTVSDWRILHAFIALRASGRDDNRPNGVVARWLEWLGRRIKNEPYRVGETP